MKDAIVCFFLRIGRRLWDKFDDQLMGLDVDARDVRIDEAAIVNSRG